MGFKRTRRLAGAMRLTGILVVAVVGASLSPLMAQSAQAVSSTTVSLVFNDGNSSQFTYGRPVLQAKGINASFYVASGWVDAASNSSMSWAQLKSLYRDGDEIGGMGKDHKSLTDTTTDNTYKTAQVCDDRSRLSAMGLDPQTFAYPQAAVDANAKSIVAGCGYRGGRTVGGLAATSAPYAEAIPPVDAFNIRTANVPNSAISLSSLQTAVNAASSHGGGWLPVSFNQVCHQGSSNYSTCMASSKPIDDVVLGQCLDLLNASGQTGGAPAGTAVKTVRNVLGASAPPPLPVDPTTVSLTFNDGLFTGYTNARSVLNAHNVHGTFYVVSSWVDNKAAGYMASWQLDKLYQDGNEIGGEGKDHKDLTDSSTDTAYKTAQVCDDRQRLAQLGYDPQTFAYPFGTYNAAAEAVVKSCGYIAARASGGLSTTGTPAEALPPKDAYAVRTVTPPTGPITLDTLKNAVNTAATQGGGWLPIPFNQVCDQADSTYSSCMAGTKPIDGSVLSAFLDWLQNGAPAGVSVKTVRQVMGAQAQPPLSARTTDVSLTFDDGTKSQYQAASILAGHNVHGTYYIPSGDIDRGDAGAMTWPQITDLAAAGNDIGGHTRDHMVIKGLDYATAYQQVCDDRARLVQLGFNPVSFAYPTGAFDAQAEGIVQACGYQSGRTAGSVSASGPLYAETEPPKDAYATRALGTTYNGPITLQSLQDAVNAAALHGGGWVQMLFHIVCFQADPGYATCMNGYRTIDDTTLNAFLDWMQNGAPAGVRIRDVAEVMGGH
jgi:peptidoglycan/xylan/chitin deacetylase (PgdA/CDA1 family)